MSELYWALDYLRSRYGSPGAVWQTYTITSDNTRPIPPVVAGQNDALARDAIEKLYERIDELEAQIKEEKE